MPQKRANSQLQQYDLILTSALMFLLCVGLVMVSSSSMVISEHYFGSSFHFIVRHIIYLLLTMAVCWLVLKIDTDNWHEFSYLLLAAAFLLLVAVFIPGIGHQANGSYRWLKFGPMTVQVSEAVKLFFIIYIASFLVRHQDHFKTRFSSFIKPILLLSAASLLLLKQPDFGAVVVLFSTGLGMMFLGGSRWVYFISISVAVISALILLAFAAPYRWERLTSFLHPWVKQFSSGYQLTQSLIAFGHGGIWGQGLGNSVQKLYYLPEAHTDFVFPVLSEELGLIGGLLVLLVFLALTMRILNIGQKALINGYLFDGYLACGIGFWLGLQVIVNVGVTSGLLPTKGLTLPFISYGGTSLIINSAAVAIVMRINYQQNRHQKQQRARDPKVAMI